ncbi:carbohydrate-binding module family 13 protein [Phlebopus sp. FC_14]|nr:carbohydrate-binding module family 13 protein [Phlebopus sp. FC_14]
MACIQSGDRYRLTNVKSGTTLDLSGGDNRSIIGYQYHGGPNQAWTFRRTGNLWIIESQGKYLTIDVDQGLRDGTQVIAESGPFEWLVEDEPGFDGVIRLLVPGTNFNIDLSDHGNPTPGTKVELWGKWDGHNQLWKLDKVQ